jgi:hypothetical protein
MGYVCPFSGDVLLGINPVVDAFVWFRTEHEKHGLCESTLINCSIMTGYENENVTMDMRTNN